MNINFLKERYNRGGVVAHLLGRGAKVARRSLFRPHVVSTRAVTLLHATIQTTSVLPSTCLQFVLQGHRLFGAGTHDTACRQCSRNPLLVHRGNVNALFFRPIFIVEEQGRRLAVDVLDLQLPKVLCGSVEETLNLGQLVQSSARAGFDHSVISTKHGRQRDEKEQK